MNAITLILMLALAACEGVWCYRLLPSALGRRAGQKPRLLLILSVVLAAAPSGLQLLVVMASRNRWAPFLVPCALIPVAAIFLARNTLVSLRRTLPIVAVLYILHTGASIGILAPVLAGDLRKSEVGPLSSAETAGQRLLARGRIDTGLHTTQRFPSEGARLPSRLLWHNGLKVVQQIVASPGSGIHIVNLRCITGGPKGGVSPRFEITGTADVVTNRLAMLAAALREALPPGYKISDLRGTRVGSFEMERTVEKDFPFNIFLAYEPVESVSARGSTARPTSASGFSPFPVVSDKQPSVWAIKRVLRDTIRSLDLVVESLAESEYSFLPGAGAVVSERDGVRLRARWGYESLVAFVERIERENPELQVWSIVAQSVRGYQDMTVEMLVTGWQSRSN